MKMLEVDLQANISLIVYIWILVPVAREIHPSPPLMPRHCREVSRVIRNFKWALNLVMTCCQFQPAYFFSRYLIICSSPHLVPPLPAFAIIAIAIPGSFMITAFA